MMDPQPEITKSKNILFFEKPFINYCKDNFFFLPQHPHEIREKWRLSTSLLNPWAKEADQLQESNHRHKAQRRHQMLRWNTNITNTPPENLGTPSFLKISHCCAGITWSNKYTPDIFSIYHLDAE